jgi:mono/diheme cytochrome c family protein
MNRRRRVLIGMLALSLTLAGFGADGSWLKSVPVRDHERPNPLRNQPDAVAAGRRIFLDRCSRCHGENAEGVRRRPPLRSQRVQQLATDGDLHWLLVNGNMRKGMPSWSKLPDPQIWQVISYLKSLPQ